MRKLLQEIWEKYGEIFEKEFAEQSDTFISEVTGALHNYLIEGTEEYKDAFSRYKDVKTKALGADTPIREEFERAFRAVEKIYINEIFALGLLIGANI